VKDFAISAVHLRVLDPDAEVPALAVTDAASMEDTALLVEFSNGRLVTNSATGRSGMCTIEQTPPSSTVYLWAPRSFLLPMSQ
jgi:hypothetical protein